MNNIDKLIESLHKGDKKALSRCISYIENGIEGYEEILTHMDFNHNIPIIGITGPPGSGKSTLINGLIKQLSANNKKTGIIAIDPTSPFNHGSLLADRLRMPEHFNNAHVFIRSLATRGHLGGLSAKTTEVVNIMKAGGFDYIFVETVGVGQSEVEIAGLADTTILVLIPGSGDEIQTLKSGIMEIADIFVVNKADREGANTLVSNLKQMIKVRKPGDWIAPVVKSIATKVEGIEEILSHIEKHK